MRRDHRAVERREEGGEGRTRELGSHAPLHATSHMPFTNADESTHGTVEVEDRFTEGEE